VSIKSKTDAKVELKRFIEKCITQFGSPPKIIRSDRGGEYTDHSIQNYMKDHGIVFQSSVAEYHEQNGVAERKNQTLLDAVRTLLISAGLPARLWNEALNYAVSTLNSIPKKGEDRSPQDIFHNRKIFHHFVEFGAKTVCLSRSPNLSKLVGRGVLGVFLGVDSDSKGYRILLDGKISVHRHVKFLSSKTNIEETQLPDPLKTRNKLPDEQFSSQSPNSNVEPCLRRSERIKDMQIHTVKVTRQRKMGASHE
jgi:hypothetical protein